MKTLLFVFGILLCQRAEAFTVLNINIFDELQGKWASDFREQRTAAFGDYVKSVEPDLVVMQEAKGVLPGAQKGGNDTVDAASFVDAYNHRRYTYEMTGADGAAYGYWMGAKHEPRHFAEDGFAFEGGVARRVQTVVFDKADERGCLGVLSLHMSYQQNKVREKEAGWVLNFLKKHEKQCKRWLVLGDFNANEKSPEMQILFKGGLVSLYGEQKPTVGAFNPIRRIYGNDIPSETIDWALGWNLNATAEVVLDSPWNGQWVSDHAAVLVKTN